MRGMPRTRALRLARLAGLALPLGLAADGSHAQELSLFVTVVDERTGETRTGLEAPDFAARDGDTPLQVVTANPVLSPVDIALLVETSVLGQQVRSLANALIEELGEGETMAVVGYHDSADLLQDFTAEKRLLRAALDRVEYGNVPRVHDALFATIDGGFATSAGRKAIILLSAGIVADSRTPETEVLAQARNRQVAVYPVFVKNRARSLLRRFALCTGGAAFATGRLKLEPRQLARSVFHAVRSPYRLGVSGVYNFGDRLEVTIPGHRKLTASARALD